MTAIPPVIQSSEALVHFQCADLRCQQWWSIADFDCPSRRWDSPYIYCPRCGRLHRLEFAAEGVLAA